MSTLQSALVVASFGRNLQIEMPDGSVQRARPAHRRLRCLCGDSVDVERVKGDWVVRHIQPRREIFYRQDKRDGKRPVAANVDTLLVLASPEPGCSAEQVDRYLAIAELNGLRPVLLRGKADLSDAAFDAMLAEFNALGYSSLSVAVDQPDSLAPLRHQLGQARSVLCGLSGAGKSTLFNALIPNAAQRTSSLSAASGEGRHTTTTTLLHQLDGGGWLVDSPGVRDIRLWPMPAGELIRGFRDLLAHENNCRFADCSHRHEPGCAVRNAVEAGSISPRRYASFCDLTDRLASQLPP